MREIKFRAWDKDGKNMVDNKFCVLQFDKVWNNFRFVLMQYTGIKDTNGVEIYEGDIVKCGYGRENTEVIEYINGGFGYNGNTWDYWEDEWGHEKMEVIGNIYENPELIK